MCKGWLKKLFGGKKSENLPMEQPSAQPPMERPSESSPLDNQTNNSETEENKEWQ